MDQDTYLKNRLDDQIKWYDQKSMWNQKLFKRLQIFQISAAAAIPFLSGYMTSEATFIKFWVGLLGVLIAVSGSLLGLYKFQENWMAYRTTCEALRQEKLLFLTKTDPYNSENPFELLVKRVESRLSGENTNWAQYMKKVPEGQKPQA